MVNNHTLKTNCNLKLRRADIEGSKSVVDMNSWTPQASYPYGNFSDTSSLKLAGNELNHFKDRKAALSRSRTLLKSDESIWLLPLCSKRDFRSFGAILWTLAFNYNKCTAPVKLPTKKFPQSLIAKSNFNVMFNRKEVFERLFPHNVSLSE